MSPDKDMAQLDLTVQKVVTSLRETLYPGVPTEEQMKRVVVNYEPLFQIAELPVVVIDEIWVSRNRFHRQVGWEAPEKSFVPAIPVYTQRKYPVYLDMRFNVVALTGKAMSLMPLEEKLLAWREAHPHITIGADGEEPYEAYEYQVDFVNDAGQSGFQRGVDHLNQFSMRFTVEAVRVYPGIEEAGKLIVERIFRLKSYDGETLLEEVTETEEGY